MNLTPITGRRFDMADEPQGGSGQHREVGVGDGPGPNSGLTPDEEKLLQRIAGQVARLGIGMPARIVLEATAPLGFLASQAMLFLKPVLGPIWTSGDYSTLQGLLEKREGLDFLIKAIEKAEEKRDGK